MTLITILNFVLAIAVIGGIVFLLATAIVSSRPEQEIVVAVEPRHVPRPYGPRTHRSRNATRRAPRHTAEPEPAR
jgi:hypothetical protein